MQRYRDATFHSAMRVDNQKFLELLGQLSDMPPGDVIWDDSIQVDPNISRPYRRGIYHFNPEESRYSDGLIRAVDRVLDLTLINKWERKAQIRLGLIGCLKQFYAAAENSMCFVIYENLRDRFNERCRKFSTYGVDIRQEPTKNQQLFRKWLKPAGNLRYANIALDTVDIRLDTRLLGFHVPDKEDSSRFYLHRCHNQRTVPKGQTKRRPIGIWRVWSMAVPKEDDARLKQGIMVPTVSPFIGGWNQTIIQTWIQIDLAWQWLYALCFVYDPGPEELLNLRYVRMRLNDYLLMDPRTFHWLTEAGQAEKAQFLDK